jgi:hypothetical protein
MSKDKRILGPPVFGSEGVPAPGHYHLPDASQRPQHNKTSLVFNKRDKSIDFIKYGFGMEEFTLKGLY